MQSSRLEGALEPLFAFLATDRPFAEVSRLAVVSRNWRTVALNALKTAPQLNLSGFAESRDEDVRLALVRVASENLKRVDLSFCHNISAGGMEDILQYMAETCSSVKEVDVTACSNEAVLRAVAIRARAVCGVHSALDLYTHLKSLEVHTEEVEEEQDEEEQEYWKRYPFACVSRLLQASTPLLLFHPELATRKNALFQAAAHGTGSDVAMLLSLSFAVGDEDESDEDDIRTYDVNEEDSQGNSPLLLACRSGNLEIAEILVVACADVSAANHRGDTPLLAAVGAGEFELAEMLVSKGADVDEEDSEGNSPLLLACRSGYLEIAEILVVAGADVSAANSNYQGDTPLLAAVGAGKFELAEMLVSKGADVDEEDSEGNSPLLLACRSGNLEMFEALLESKADVNVINGDGASALHLVIASDNARSFEMFETLLKAGADVNVVRHDGASILALAIDSDNARILNCRMMPKMIEYAESAEISYVCHLSLAFLEPNNIFRWLKDGRSARELLGVLCALMASAATERAMQDRLSHVRAFINCHIDLLQDPTPLAPLTVTHVVKQLALQELDSVFDSNTDPQWNASIERGVVWVNKPPVQHACRWTMQARGNVKSLAYSSDRSRLARAEGNDVVVCDAVSGFEVHRLKGHRASVNSVVFSADGAVIASGSSDSTVRLWDVVAGSCNCTLTGHSDVVNAVTWSPDGKSLASASDDKTVRIWDASTEKLKSTLTGDSHVVESVAWNNDGTKLATGSWDTTVRLWSLGSAGTFECQSTLSGHKDPVRSVCFSPCGTKIVSGGGLEKDWGGNEDFSIRIWDAETDTQIGSPLNGHSNWVYLVSWSPDGASLASGSRDNTIKVWNATSGECQSTLNGHTRSVTKVEYVDAETLVSGSEDGTMRVWSVATGAHKEELDGGSFAFSKDSSSEQKVGKYSIAFKDDLLLISECQSVVAFFRSPHVISTIGTAGERIAVGCKNGEVLQLRADWLV